MTDHGDYCNMFNFDSNLYDEEYFEVKKDSDEMLIDAVRAYPHLYNQQDCNFKDKVMKENSWKEIAQTLNLAVHDCKHRWKALRERFTKEKRQKENDTKSGSGATQRTIFTFFDQMAFLNDHVKRRKSYTNVSNVKRQKPTVLSERHSFTASTLTGIEKSSEAEKDSVDIISSESAESSGSKTLQSRADELMIQPCSNFSSGFKKNFLEKSGDVLSTSSNSNQCSNNFSTTVLSTRSSAYDSDDSRFSVRDCTSSPSILQRKRRPLKGKNNMDHFENSVNALCQTLTTHFHEKTSNLREKSNFYGTKFEELHNLIDEELGKLPLLEQLNRQREILKILQHPYNR